MLLLFLLLFCSCSAQRKQAQTLIQVQSNICFKVEFCFNTGLLTVTLTFSDKWLYTTTASCMMKFLYWGEQMNGSTVTNDQTQKQSEHSSKFCSNKWLPSPFQIIVSTHVYWLCKTLRCDVIYTDAPRLFLFLCSLLLFVLKQQISVLTHKAELLSHRNRRHWGLNPDRDLISMSRAALKHFSAS